ncbi:MAG: alkaline phosphatase family protein [Candidatus Latescibacterota bacterium]|nr:alkaline phosphatase family protein [Candidatus Latescibacterota bacterium]
MTITRSPAFGPFSAGLAQGTRVLPEYDGGSIVNVTASILQAFGCEPPSAPLRTDLLNPAVLSQAPGGVVCLVVDALGLAQLQAGLTASRAPRLQRFIDEHGLPRRLTSIFPSTTTAALTSLATAQPPSKHGILGHVLWIEEVRAACNVLHFTPVGRPDQPIDDDLLRCEPTIHERVAAAGFDSVAITAAAYEGTAFTNLLQRGGEFVGYQTQSQIPYLLEQTLSAKSGQGRCFVGMYWPHIDTIAHVYGPDLPEAPCEASALELEFVDQMIGHTADICRRYRCALLITADHGQASLDPHLSCSLPRDLLANLRQRPAGGRRAAYLACDHPAELAQSVVPHASDLLPMDEVIDAGWFGGPLSPVFRQRIGDWLALAHDGVQFLIDDGDGVFPQLGGHAGLTPHEMEVPLLLAPAD